MKLKHAPKALKLYVKAYGPPGSGKSRYLSQIESWLRANEFETFTNHTKHTLSSRRDKPTV